MDEIPKGVERTRIQQELPRGMERRLVLRLLAHWRDMCGDRTYPSFADLDPASIPDMWPHCFVLELAGHKQDAVFRLVGEAIAGHAPAALVGRRASEVDDRSLVGVTIDYMSQVLAKGVPISHGGEFYRDGGTRVLYRSIVLPMSDDGETISGLLCAANCREVEEA